MKRFLFCLILVSAPQTLLSMEPEEIDAQEAIKLEKIAHHPEYWNNLDPFLNLNNLKEVSGQQAYQNTVDQLNTIVDLANAYNDKIQSYLNGEITNDNELKSIDSRIPIHSIVERLLLNDNPRKITALEVIVLHARALSYHNPLNYLGNFPGDDSVDSFFRSLRANDTAPLRFLVNPAKPSTIPLEASKTEIGCKLTIFGYLINKLPLPGLVKDNIHTYVLADLLRKIQITPLSFNALSLNDLQQIQSNVRALKLSETFYAEAIDTAITECGKSIKNLRVTYNQTGLTFTFLPQEPKVIEFNKHIKPIVTQYLPSYRLN